MKSYKSPVSTSAVVYKARAKHSGFDGFSRGFAAGLRGGDDMVSNNRPPQKLGAIKRS